MLRAANQRQDIGFELTTAKDPSESALLVEAGRADAKDNMLKHAPHTAATVLVHEWTRPYTREQAVYPTEYARTYKFWPTVARIDSAYGDRNLICSCTPLEQYVDAEEQLVPTDKGPSY